MSSGARLSCLLSAVLLLPLGFTQGQNIPVISTTNDLHAIAHATWTNTAASKIYPPSSAPFRSSLGAIAFDAAFDTNFLNALVPLTNGGVTRFPVTAVESNTEPRERGYFNVTGGLVQVAAVPGGYDWQAVARETYGQPPVWLSGETLTNWYTERDPARQQVLVDLISTSSVAAYLAMLTNSIGSVWDGTNDVPLLSLYSNDIAFVKTELADGAVRAWVHAPTNVVQIDLFRSLDLVAPLGWTLVSGLSHGTDPLMWDCPWTNESVALAAGDAGFDQDGDGLSDAREILIYGTSVATNDTDGDGLTDGEEIYRYGLNALNPNTDGDWFTDLYEVGYGSNPTDSEVALPLGFLINGGAFYVNSTNVTLHFTGIQADTVSVKEGVTNAFASTNAFTETVAYSLTSESNGLKRIFAYLMRGTNMSPVMTANCILDTIAPSLSVTNFPDGVVTNARWVSLHGTATDGVSAVSVRINGEWADGVAGGSFHHSRVVLTNGANTITLTGTDAAGNVTTQLVHAVQETAGDTNAPLLSLALPYDAEVIEGVTNTLSTTTLPSDDLLYVQGTSDDETADFLLVSEDSAGGILIGTVVQAGAQLWMTVSLVPGTNTLVLSGVDAAGNTGVVSRTIIRDTNLLFAITNPLPYEAVHDTGVVVSGVADLRFTNAIIMVNGISCTLNVLSNRVEFATDAPVPLSDRLTALKGQAIAGGRIYFCDPDVAHYETRRWDSRHEHLGWSSLLTCGGYLDGPPPNPYQPPYLIRSEYESLTMQSWDAASCTWSRTLDESYFETNTPLKGDHSLTTNWQHEVWEALSPPTVVSSGYAVASSGLAEPCNYEGTGSTDHYDDSLEFVKVAATQATQLVVFQFLDLEYGRPPNTSINPSNITFRGQSGFWYNGNVAFIVPIVLNQSYTISGADFTWPSYSFTTESDGNSSGHWLSFAGYTNNVLKVEIDPLDRAPFPDGIAPHQTREVNVTIQPDLSGTSRFIEFDVIHSSSAHGFAHITSGTKTRTSSGTITVEASGSLEVTDSGVGPQLIIRARLDGQGEGCSFSRPFAVCSHVTDFQQTDASAEPGGVLHFEYAWESDSGYLPDLGAVQVDEWFTASGPTPNPPFDWNSPDTYPNHRDGPLGYAGALQDNLLNNFESGDCVLDGPVTQHLTTQYYRQRCLRCQKSGTPNLSDDPQDLNWGIALEGPLTIFRIVEPIIVLPNTMYWRYRISRGGSEAIINDLPDCKP